MNTLKSIAGSICFGIAAVGLAVSSAQAGLIGLSSSSPGQLYTVNATTGAATPFLTISSGTSFTGLEFFGGSYYATDIIAGGSFGFGRINPTTGIVTILNATQDGSSNWWALARNDSLGVLYTVDRDNGEILKSINPATGVTTTIGATGILAQGSGLAYDSASNILYSVAIDGNLYTLNLGTGASALIGATGLSFSNVHQGLAYDPTTATLFLNEADTFDSLYTLNVLTGVASLVGPNGAVAGFGIDGLMFLSTDVPEPATLTLFGLGLLGLGAARRRKQKAA